MVLGSTFKYRAHKVRLSPIAWQSLNAIKKNYRIASQLNEIAIPSTHPNQSKKKTNNLLAQVREFPLGMGLVYCVFSTCIQTWSLTKIGR